VAADEALDVKYVNAAAAVDDDGGLSSLALALAVADEVDTILGGGMAEEEDADAGGANVNEAPKASAADTEGVTGVAAALVVASSSSLPVNFDIISVERQQYYYVFYRRVGSVWVRCAMFFCGTLG
jgi:hypothetical protein